MAHKQVSFRSAAREKILRGATQLADAVRVTLGPRSKSVLIEKKWGAPIVCNDGVRSRIREWAFGGMTRSLLKQGAINRLLSN
jgi:chaperonin GroEL (HSP60 family)